MALMKHRSKTKIKKYELALDWTPNVNHIGFIVAKEKGFYDNLNIHLNIQSPHTDSYQNSPAKKVELGIADFALCPTESILSFRAKKNPFKLFAIGTIFQEDVSAIAVDIGSSIRRPRDLDGKTYASYGARYEDLIVKQLIKNDGGKGEINIHYPERLGVWNTMKNNLYDSTWVFMNWEGIEHQALNFFRLKEYDIPYSYSPLIVCSEKLINDHDVAVNSFLKATKEGFMYAMSNIIESAEILNSYLPEIDRKIDVVEALKFSKSYFGGAEVFGKINKDVLRCFFDWLKSNQIESQAIDVDEIYVKYDF